MEKRDRDAFAKAVDHGVTLAAIIHVAAEERPAVNAALQMAAAKVVRMTPVDGHNAGIPPKVREVLDRAPGVAPV